MVYRISLLVALECAAISQFIGRRQLAFVWLVLFQHRRTWPSSTLASKALKIPRHFSAQRQIASIEPLNLLHARSSVLGEVEDVDLSVTEDNPHTYCGMAKRID